MALWKKTTIIIIIIFFFLWWHVRTCHTSAHGPSHGWIWGDNAPKFFLKNIIKYIDTNFSNFVLENYTFVLLKISLILLKVLL